jgi:hypothetical protein
MDVLFLLFPVPLETAAVAVFDFTFVPAPRAASMFFVDVPTGARFHAMRSNAIGAVSLPASFPSGISQDSTERLSAPTQHSLRRASRIDSSISLIWRTVGTPVNSRVAEKRTVI